MAVTDLLTVGDVAEIFGVDPWRVRKAVDSIDCGLVRAGLYRLIPRSQLATIAAELRQRGWLHEGQGVPHGE